MTSHSALSDAPMLDPQDDSPDGEAVLLPATLTPAPSQDFTVRAYCGPIYVPGYPFTAILTHHGRDVADVDAPGGGHPTGA
ncbi:hypothetical protein CLV92_1207 [Kineococcus xinjiangensis]|uniref:Uncharacterized protein n=1 Tax=Kineococcus xinjiangensis TaxID=512762 RepID=A0A2S6ICD7_9ACTN|nr:hypothetical protein [Kineococcus xinjiangensis]PPK91888.1 hypothetical protein CLV92_1207 [Kineococcus xinjiangensis]